MPDSRTAWGFFTGKPGKGWPKEVLALQRAYLAEWRNSGCVACAKIPLRRKYLRKLKMIEWTGT